MDILHDEDLRHIQNAVNDVSHGPVRVVELTLKNASPAKVYAVGDNVVRVDFKK